MCKLFASDVAVWVSQEAMLLHGGWGYEVYPFDRQGTAFDDSYQNEFAPRVADDVGTYCTETLSS